MTAAALVVFSIASPSEAAGQASGPAATTVRLRVFAHAAVGAPDLELAKATASTLLESVRIGLEWDACGTVENGCNEPDDPDPIVVLLLPVWKMTREDVSAEVVRYRPPRGPTVIVYLSNLADRVRIVRESAAGRTNPALATFALGHLLGLAIAHETGHVVGFTHARSGVMKARFTTDDLLALRESRLVFLLRGTRRFTP